MDQIGSSNKDNKDNKDYKDTLHLPKTDYPMRAGLAEREPHQVKKWIDDRVYYRMVEKNRAQKAPRFLLHDGPPYANGNIHIGHALNKVLKDVVVKYKNMSGFESQFIPGWDCHGLPIELGVEKQLLEQKKDKASFAVTELRQLCRDYAKKYVELQMSQFQRLEIFADWEKPYLTMDQNYVASIVRSLGRCSESGALYQGNKPVYWCTTCSTALAEAEIEYADKTSPSIYVKFDCTEATLKAFPELNKIFTEEQATRASVVIWTTTPWTLPSNLAVCLHPEFNYVVIKSPGLEGTELLIVAEGLQESFEKVLGFEKKSEPLLTFKSERLHKQTLKHPFINRTSLIIQGTHVTLEAGTGAVHTAPGHGVDDYKIGSRYGLEIFAPVDAKGKFTDGFEPMKGQYVFKANEPIIQLLQTSGHLVARKNIQHSYPHCWRCHDPVIFRATPQWFIGMESFLRKEAVEAIHEVEWVPSWGKNRILGMMESRPDWCISRQRLWGVPITVFFCESCEAPLANKKVFDHVANQIHEHGTDIWFTAPVEQLLPSGSECSQCHSKKFRKEKDILDVWFDSGVSHAAVCEDRELGWPADLYLEGSDQHRGWFQTSLLTGIAMKHQAPFKTVLTHGFVNDKDGKKMSKSKGNVTSPLDIMKTQGAEVLRLWVILEDYRNDVSFSKESLDRVTESYRKIRNTLRFMLGNLFDYDPQKDAVSDEQLGDLDRWALSKTAKALEAITQAYDAYEFHQVYHLINQLCTVDLSSVYFDILKDRLYTQGKKSLERRSSQTALWKITSALTRAMAPVLSFTAEEVWGFFPVIGARDSVFLESYPRGDFGLKKYYQESLESQFDVLWDLRNQALKILEEARQRKEIGHPREVRLLLKAKNSKQKELGLIKEDLTKVLGVSQLVITTLPETEATDYQMEVKLAEGKKCERCWTTTQDTGSQADHPGLCLRCTESL